MALPHGLGGIYDMEDLQRVLAILAGDCGSVPNNE